MPVYTTEIASDKIQSDNPIHQRLLKPYIIIGELIKGDVLEVGCGEGRGIEILNENSSSLTAIDKIQEVIDSLSTKYPNGRFIQGNIPPFSSLENDSFDFVVSFQVIEHIKKDIDYLKEIFRVLKKGGTAYITTPNRIKTLSRNPWHIREYTSGELESISKDIFSEVEMKGITGSEKVWEYYERNKKSVENITRWDILDLQHRLPNWMLRVPYDILNRFNRNKLQDEGDALVKDISDKDYLLSENPEDALDLFAILKK